MSFRLLDRGWGDEFDGALRADHSTVRVVCPFIKRGAAELLYLNVGRYKIERTNHRLRLPGRRLSLFRWYRVKRDGSRVPSAGAGMWL